MTFVTENNSVKAIQHKSLAAGRWEQLPFMEQMANIGSEVNRALNWKSKNNPEYCQRAAGRAMELTSLSLGSSRSPSRRRELARVKEALADYFFGDNEFHSSAELWRNYFQWFHYACRKNC